MKTMYLNAPEIFFAGAKPNKSSLINAIKMNWKCYTLRAIFILSFIIGGFAS